MVIKVEFNLELILRSFELYKEGKGELGEYIPEKLEVGKNYPFLKKGQVNYWLEGEIPLMMEGEGRPKLLGRVEILWETHFPRNDGVYTRGRYLMKELFGRKD